MWGNWLARWALKGKTISHREKLLSALGGVVAMLGVVLISQHFLGVPGLQQAVVASMGASAVLLFAVPHGPLSQPWPVLGGHVISALVGITCARFIGPPVVAASLAVGLAIGVMYYARCIHPPGGATALTAVMGGAEVHALGYQFVIFPILVNVLLILGIAFLFNYPFYWRRYPASVARPVGPPPAKMKEPLSEIDHGDFVYALSQLDSFVDVSEADLLRIYALATGHARTHHLLPADIHAPRYYSNGKTGESWSVRQVVDESHSADPNKDRVIFRTVDGAERGHTAMVTRTEFGRWAAYEVERHGEGWKRQSAHTA